MRGTRWKYQPMRDPNKPVATEDKMKEILARRVAQAEEIKSQTSLGLFPSINSSESEMRPPQAETQSPQAKSVALIWESAKRENDHLFVMYSRCTRYSIDAERSKLPVETVLGGREPGKRSHWFYRAYRRTPEWNNLIYYGASKEDALRACELHNRKYPAPGIPTDSTESPSAQSAPDRQAASESTRS